METIHTNTDFSLSAFPESTAKGEIWQNDVICEVTSGRTTGG